MKTHRIILVLVAIAIVGAAALAAALLVPQWLQPPLNIYRLDDDSAGCLEKVNNIVLSDGEWGRSVGSSHRGGRI